MLHLDLPTRAEILSLSEIRHPASVSIALPTCKVDGGLAGCRILFGNLIKEAIQTLESRGVDKRTIWPIEDLLVDVAEDDTFWNFQANSLVVLATPEHVWTFRLPNELNASVVVGDRFFLKPLLRATTFCNHAFVLALAINSVNFYEAVPGQSLAEVKLADLPKSAADAVRVGSLAISTQSRRSDGSAAQRARLAQYCRIVDRALREVLAGLETPLFLVADPTIGAIYRTVSSYPHLAAEGIGESPEDISMPQLSDAIRPLLDATHAAELATVLALAKERKAAHRTATTIAHAAQAATFGAVDTLVVDMDKFLPGSIDEISGEVTPATEGQPADYGVTDEIARRVLASGGRVLSVRAGDLPEGAPVVALLRFPTHTDAS